MYLFFNLYPFSQKNKILCTFILCMHSAHYVLILNVCRLITHKYFSWKTNLNSKIYLEMLYTTSDILYQTSADLFFYLWWFEAKYLNVLRIIMLTYRDDLVKFCELCDCRFSKNIILKCCVCDVLGIFDWKLVFWKISRNIYFEFINMEKQVQTRIA